MRRYRNRFEVSKFDGIDITNLIDILMVLLLIFMIMTPPIIQKKAKVNLPDAHVQTRDFKGSLDITLTKDGSFYIDKQQCTESEFKKHLSDLYARKQLEKVVINADEEIPYEKVLDTVAYLQDLKVSSIHLSAAPKQDEPPAAAMFISGFKTR